MAPLNWASYLERAVGKGHPTLSDTVNRALRQLLTESGYDPDASPFPGLMGPVLNLKSYGVLFDHSTDNSAAIQAAMDDLPSEGGILYGSPGVAMVGSSLLVPTDKHIVLCGPTSHVTNQGVGPAFGGVGTFGGFCLRRLPDQSGPMVSQSTASASPGHGIHLHDVTLDGNDQSNDLLVLSHVHRARLSRVNFYRTNGHGLHTTFLINSWLDECSWFECGSASTYGWFVDSDGAGQGCVTVFVTQPHFEAGRGTFFRSEDTGGSGPHINWTWLGGKMEQSGNQLTSTPAVPLMDLNNVTEWSVLGLCGINGMAYGATHIKLTNCDVVTLDTVHTVSSTLAENQNPQRFIHVNGAGNVKIRGTYTHGGGNGGEQIKIETSSTNISLDPTNKYNSPVGTGVPVRWGSTPGTMERAGTGWTGLQSIAAMSLGAGTVLEGPGRGNSIARVSSGGSNIVLSAGNKGDMFVVVHQGSTNPIEFNPTDATSRVYKAQNATIYPGEVGIFLWDSGLSLWVKSTSRQRSVQSPVFAASFIPLPLDGEIIEVGALTNNIVINDVNTGHKRKGMIVTFRFLQDGTGGRTVTWNAVWRQAWSDTGNTANKKSTISFYCTDGTNFEQVGAQSPYF